MGHSTNDGLVPSLLSSRSRRRGGKRMCQLFFTYISTTILILFYYTCSIGLTFYQKHLFKDFRFPLTVVVVHLCIKFILAGLCRETYSLWTGLTRVNLPWNLYIKRLFPPGIAAGLDIGLSQWSLEFISIALYTMSKSTALLFILFFAILFKLEEMKYSVVMLVALIAGGLFMFTYKYTQFNLFGFLLVLSASILSGLRWTLSETVMRKGELGLTNPIDMVYHIQPWMMVPLMPLAVFMEGNNLVFSEKGFRYQSFSSVSFLWLQIGGGALIAFLMEISEFMVVCYTSSLTLSIAGVAKEIVTLSLAVYYYHEQLSLINQLGLVCCILGISLHVLMRAAARVPANTKGPPPLSSLVHQSAPNSDSAAATPLLSHTDSEDNEIFSR